MEKVRPSHIAINRFDEEIQIKNIETIDKRKFYSLLLKNGSTVIFGEDTLVQTIDGPKKIQDITPDDYIYYKFVNYNDSPGGLDISWEQDINATHSPIKIPKKMNKDFALWLGILASKGRYNESSGYVAVTLNDKTIGRVFHDLTKKVFKAIPKIYNDKRGNTEYYLISINLIRFLKTFIGVNSSLKKVPNQIIEGSKEEQINFLKGLSLDGYLDQGYWIIYGGVSKRLADFAAAVLRNSGYTIYQQVRKTGQGNNTYYTKIGSKLDQNFCEFFPLELEKTEGFRNSGHLVKVTEEILNFKVPVTNPGYSALRNLKQKKATTCYNTTLEEIGFENYKKDEYCVMVKEVQVNIDSGFSIEIDSDSVIFNGIILQK